MEAISTLRYNENGSVAEIIGYEIPGKSGRNDRTFFPTGDGSFFTSGSPIQQKLQV